MNLGNYKIKVTTEAESKEAQELFEQFGLIKDDFDDCGFPYYVASDDDGTFNNYILGSDTSGWKELTIPQLRDLVVLHRNDVSDATHTGGERKGFLSSDGIEYFWNAHNLMWFKAKQMTFAYEKFKHIQEQNLISGSDALRALADGKDVEYLYGNKWLSVIGEQVLITAITDDKFKFRLKPRTITLNIEIPACETNYKHGQLIWILSSLEPNEYCSVVVDESDELPAYWWSSENDIKQVVAALRGALKNG